MYAHVQGVYYPEEESGKTFLCKTWVDVEKYVLEPRAMICHGTNLGGDVEPCFTTLKYMFNHMRCGIYVLILEGKLAMFAPFANASYENNFDMHMTTSVDKYSQTKAAAFKKPVEVLLPMKKWWTNAGGIMCNVMPPDVWGDYMLAEHKQFLLHICGQVQDCEFILNKRDHPQLRKDLTEAYAHCFYGKQQPLPEEYRTEMLPIVSGYTGPLFSDVAWPLPCDMAELRPVTRPWHLRSSSAIFRGSSTGSIPHNARMDLCLLSTLHPHILDAKLTAWNTRDRLVMGQVTALCPDVRLQLAPKMSMDQQQSFKYVVYIEGHSAASRYLQLMLHGFVIIKVDTRHTTADQLWYFDQLVDGVDHVRVSADLSNLIPCIHWLKAHDELALAIASRAQALGTRILASQQEYAIKTLNAFK
jgi:hypothetical protein